LGAEGFGAAGFATVGRLVPADEVGRDALDEPDERDEDVAVEGADSAAACVDRLAA